MKEQFDYIKQKINLKTIFHIKKIYGGINNNFFLHSQKGKFFVKINDEKLFPKMLNKENKGLELLIKSSSINIPKPIFSGQYLGKSILVLEWIDENNPKRDFWVKFGIQLANMHKNTNPYFGLDYDNYIGNIIQYNNKQSSWIDFFVHQRLEKNLKLAFDKLSLDKSLISSFEKLFFRIANIFPNTKPSLLHGDLWNGNFMCDVDYNPIIFDPAVYYGNREMDISMSKLFGGFDNLFYESYHSQFPLQDGWEDRVDLCNLYPLMVHLNIFGLSYLSSVKKIIKKYS